MGLWKRPWLLWGLGLGLALRLGYAWYGLTRVPIPTTNDAYETLALSVLGRGEYALEPGRPTSLREPAYPLFIAAVYWISGGRRPWALLVAQCLLGAATAAFVAALAHRLFGETAAKLGLWTYALYPASLYYCAFFFRETLMGFLVTLLAYASLYWTGSGPGALRWTAVSGLCAAALGLANSAALPALGLSGLALARAAPSKTRLVRGVLYWAPLVLGMLLWTARNWSVHGALVPGSTHGGEEFYQALVVLPEDLGTQRQTEIVNADPAIHEAGRLSEAGRNAYLMAAGAAWIREHPGRYLSRCAARLFKFWKLWPYQRRYHHAYLVLVAVSALSDGWIIPLGLCGLWLFRGRWAEVAAAPALLLGFTVTYAALHAVIRYRVPLMGLMIVLASGAGLELWRRLWASPPAAAA